MTKVAILPIPSETVGISYLSLDKPNSSPNLKDYDSK